MHIYNYSYILYYNNYTLYFYSKQTKIINYHIQYVIIVNLSIIGIFSNTLVYNKKPSDLLNIIQNLISFL